MASMTAFAFFNLQQPSCEHSGSGRSSSGTVASSLTATTGPLPPARRAPAGASVTPGYAAAHAPSADACPACSRPLSGRCAFCAAAGGGARVCDSCCAECDGCGRSACGACGAARFCRCPDCDFLACDECRTQPDDDVDDGRRRPAPFETRGCWCQSGRKRYEGNRRFVSTARYKALSLTHPSLRASSMKAAGLRDDDDDAEDDTYVDDHFIESEGEGEGDGNGDIGEGRSHEGCFFRPRDARGDAVTPRGWGPSDDTNLAAWSASAFGAAAARAANPPAPASGLGGGGSGGPPLRLPSGGLETLLLPGAGGSGGSDGGAAVRRALMRYGSALGGGVGGAGGGRGGSGRYY